MPSALIYLKDNLNFKLVEWRSLSENEKDAYKLMAEQEMKVLGIEVSSPKK